MSIDQNGMHRRPNVVLVHGAWADGSSWSSVIERLQADGYHVTAPQFPLTSLADDVARLRHVLALQDEPTVIAGHSYGGPGLTALRPHPPKHAGPVSIAGLGISPGRSLRGPFGRGHPPPAPPRPPVASPAGRTSQPGRPGSARPASGPVGRHRGSARCRDCACF